jgi:uncharacterized protein
MTAEFITFIPQLSRELGVTGRQAAAVLELLSGGATVPFIARYRKEATGSLDEVAVTNIRDRFHQIQELEKRRATVLSSVTEQGKLSPELKGKILAAATLAALEDLYLPYRPKRRTRGTVAREKGLEPLARMIFDQAGGDPSQEARKYLDREKEVNTAEDALCGARDIIAEWVNESAPARAALRGLYRERAVMRSRVIRGKDKEGEKFRDYFDWQEPAKTAPSHRILAVRRGEKEGILSLKVQPEEEDALRLLIGLFVTGNGAASRQVRLAVDDAFRRLLALSMETELRLEMKKRADQEAIEIFSQNLRELLMAPPLGQKRVMAVDPGLRTGCKVVCLGSQGELLYNDTVYLVGSEAQRAAAAAALAGACREYNIEVIAVGNGTAGRETEAFIRPIPFGREIPVVVVSESGASIYSASEAAREEFPGHDVTVRGAVSIGRRLMDPLAELVKIDPKSIGVGQYQHDVDQKLLRLKLDDVVISCVNRVGVEVNTASRQLLAYVSGVGPALAAAIVARRQAAGAFTGRRELTLVDGMGPRAFEQAAGFLRIHGAANPLDASAVHPESYPVVERMAGDLGCSVRALAADPDLQKKIDLARYVSGPIGLPTLLDIRAELARPGRDPRPAFSVFRFTEGITGIDDLAPGMVLDGVVTNITAFGAFVDIGVHHDGLVHISQLSERFVKDPHDIVRVHQPIRVRVLEVDKARGRIALSARKPAQV